MTTSNCTVTLLYSDYLQQNNSYYSDTVTTCNRTTVITVIQIQRLPVTEQDTKMIQWLPVTEQHLLQWHSDYLQCNNSYYSDTVTACNRTTVTTVIQIQWLPVTEHQLLQWYRHSDYLQQNSYYSDADTVTTCNRTTVTTVIQWLPATEQQLLQ